MSYASIQEIKEDGYGMVDIILNNGRVISTGPKQAAQYRVGDIVEVTNFISGTVKIQKISKE